MHAEKSVVSKKFLVHLKKKIDDPVIPVGTTSMRTLESLYWLAVRINSGDKNLYVEQWDPYKLVYPGFSPANALNVIIDFIEENKLNELKFETRLMIAPGYQFRFASGLITNFHQPKSTLLLLVSALIGDRWKEAYHFAVQNGFRFLSYGDSCLFFP
jgi:S-adenosylmethionine:tRNA ribosyltransferase-isomerase